MIFCSIQRGISVNYLLFGAYFVPGAVLGGIYQLPTLLLHHSLEADIIMPIS